MITSHEPYLNYLHIKLVFCRRILSNKKIGSYLYVTHMVTINTPDISFITTRVAPTKCAKDQCYTTNQYECTERTEHIDNQNILTTRYDENDTQPVIYDIEILRTITGNN